MAEERRNGKNDKNEQRIIEKLRRVFYHPDLAYCVRFIKSQFPISMGAFILTLCILFLTNVVLGFTSYSLDIFTDIKFTLSMFNMTFTTNIDNSSGLAFVGTLTNINQTILAVQEPEQFFYAGVISSVHVAISFIMSLLFFVCMEWGRLSKKESLSRIPIPLVSKAVGFFLEFKRLKLFREQSGAERDRKVKKMTKDIETHSDYINLSLMVEAAFEAGKSH